MSHDPRQTPSYFKTPALDHAAAGIGAGSVATLCMNPLDLVKVKFQVATQPTPGRGLGKQIYSALKDIWIDRGIKGLYRGVGANMFGNAASWGLYFWLWVETRKE
jgi:solute carrier family 25 folate transporter 32